MSCQEWEEDSTFLMGKDGGIQAGRPGKGRDLARKWSEMEYVLWKLSLILACPSTNQSFPFSQDAVPMNLEGFVWFFMSN